jgi:spore coat polysaccharide biosynthesis protein SpsF (cytidylyltransferase family)
VRLTGDCPLLDPAVSGLVVAEYLRRSGAIDYASNVHPPTYPDGLDTEVISARALETAWTEARRPSDREHVTPYVWRQPGRFRLANVGHDRDLSALRWTVDDARDLALVRQVYSGLSPDGRSVFGMTEVLDLLRARPGLAGLNAGTRRNEGLERSERADLTLSRGQGS